MNIEEQYLALLEEVLHQGHRKSDRTGTGTISLFGRSLRHRMSEGFPLLTTKHVSLQNVATELIWFMQGRTDLRWLLARNCHIWVGDAYKRYRAYAGSLEEPDYDVHVDDPKESRIRLMTRQEFIDEILQNDQFSRRFGDLGPVYGKQWRSWQVELEHSDGVSYYKYPNIDQLMDVVKTLKENPDSRRMMVTAWNPSELESMILPPCHYGFQVYTRELTFSEKRNLLFSNHPLDSMPEGSGSKPMLSLCDEYEIPTRAISLMWTQRSVDIPLGLPYNIASYALLLEILAREVNMVPEELSCSLGDCHIYLDQVEGVKTQLEREPFGMPSLQIEERFHLPDSVATLSLNDKLKQMEPDWFRVHDYQHHPKITFPLSN